MWLFRVGIASTLPPMRGNQKLWITSEAWMSKTAVWFAGRCNSFAVVMPRSGYWNSHHHWWPITVTRRFGVSALTGAASEAKIVLMVGTAIIKRTIAGMIVQATS